MYSNSDLFWDMLKQFQKMRKKQSRNRKFTINTDYQNNQNLLQTTRKFRNRLTMGVLPTLRKINNTITLDEIQKAFN